jgi:acetylornithine/N-succinyldiaminopimelate aminotransferase
MLSFFEKIIKKILNKSTSCKCSSVNQSALFSTHNRAKLCFKRGKGCYLYTPCGKKYLDFTSGIAVNALGYSNKKVNRALHKQSKKLWHVSNLYIIPEAEEFANLICNKTFADKVFFCNSGAEAIETVIKTIRRYHYIKGNPEKNRIITFKGSFHGRTIATVCASGNTKYMEGFAPHLDGFDNIEYGDIKLVEKTISQNTAGIILEPIQGEGGVNFAGFEFLRQIRDLCNKNNILLGLDEVQCGNSRTGKIFAYEHANIVPDILGTAKGIANGFPLGMVLATNDVANAISVGTHGTTYGSNPLAMKVGIEVFNQISQDSFLQNVTEISNYFHNKLNETLLNPLAKKIITNIKGYGLMIGLKIDQTYNLKDIVLILRENGLLVTTAGTDVIRILPPLIATKKEVDIAIKAIKKMTEQLK